MPSYAALNTGNMPLGNPVLTSQVNLPRNALQAPNTCGVQVSNDGATVFDPDEPICVRLQSNTKSMFVVLGSGNPLQVFSTIVGLDSVQVIDFLARQWGTVKSSGDKTVKRTGCRFAVAGQHDVQITRAIQSGCQNPSNLRPRARHNSPNPSQVGYVVPALVSDDRTPFFNSTWGGFDSLN